MSQITTRTPQTPEEWEAYFDLRYRVLREPLGKERGTERNEGDKTATHFACFKNNQIIGVARLDRLDETCCQVRFVAIETNLQGQGIGKIIMDAVEYKAKTDGFKTMVLHARDYALPFYQKLGYQLVGPSYKLFDSLQHFEMNKRF
jgi:N-acetylglutamate synthase-like GNAT family acetyltransferase